jgi:hypothetical protein
MVLSKERMTYKRLFPIELQAWQESVSQFEGEVNDELVYDVLDLVFPAFKKAISCGMVFDVMETASGFSRAAKYLVDERMIAFKILASLPDPLTLSEDERLVLSAITEKVEDRYRGTIAYLERKWALERRRAAAKLEESANS